MTTVTIHTVLETIRGEGYPLLLDIKGTFRKATPAEITHRGGDIILESVTASYRGAYAKLSYTEELDARVLLWETLCETLEHADELASLQQGK